VVVFPEIVVHGLPSPGEPLIWVRSEERRWLMDATRRRVELAAELRKARQARGYTQTRVAAFLGCGQGKIAKIENAVNEVKPQDLDRLLQLYDPPEVECLKMKALAALPGPGRAAASRPQTEYVDFSTRATRASVLLALHSERIPVPLQSNRYRFKLYQEADDPAPQTRLILDRNHRAEIFTEPGRSTLYRVLLSESAFRRLPGGETPDLVIDQAQYLLALTERYERLQLQVVPFKAKIPFLDPDFTVLKFEDPREDVAYVDSSVDAQIIPAAQRVADREEYWHLVQRAATSVDDSRKFLRTLIDGATAELAADNS
jgi:transcriptional regulator with XRE-family HTH domain